MSHIAFLLGHGARGKQAAERAEALSQPSPTVQAIASPDAINDALSRIAADVPGQSVIRFVHLVDAEDDAALRGVGAGVAHIRSVMNGFPAVHAQQFVVALVGREWDTDEKTTLLALDRDVVATFIIARSNEAAVELRAAEEEAMASDLAYALIVSRLPNELGAERFWLAGTSAVYYRRRALVAALMAFHLGKFVIEHLLADLPIQHTECDEGRAFVEERHLGLWEHLQWLDRSPMGGSVHSEIRLNQEHFAKVPPELLVDALRSFVQQSADHQLALAQEQIERNRTEHLAAERKALAEQVRETLSRTKRIASARRFAECAAEALNQPLQSLQVALSAATDEAEADAAEQDAVEQELAKNIHALPYPWAVAARTLGFGALGIASYHLIAAATALDPNFAVLGLVGGVILASPLTLRYRQVQRRIDALRRRYLALAERRVRNRAKLAVLEAALAEVRDLRVGADGASGSLTARLDNLADVLRDLARSQEEMVRKRDTGALVSTRLSLLVPTTDDISTQTLVEQLPLPADFPVQEVAMRCIVSQWDLGEVDQDAVTAALIDAFEPALRTRLWRDLSVLLNESDATRQAVHRVLTTETAPIVRTGELTRDRGTVRRMLIAPKNALEEAVLSQIQNAGSLQTSEPDAYIQVALRPVPAAMRETGGTDVPLHV